MINPCRAIERGDIIWGRPGSEWEEVQFQCWGIYAGYTHAIVVIKTGHVRSLTLTDIHVGGEPQ